MNTKTKLAIMPGNSSRVDLRVFRHRVANWQAKVLPGGLQYCRQGFGGFGGFGDFGDFGLVVTLSGKLCLPCAPLEPSTP